MLRRDLSIWRSLMRGAGTAVAQAALLLSMVCALESPAAAKDLEMLKRLLIPAYMAQNFAAVCVAQDRYFLSDLNSGISVVSAFAEHVKAEITSELPEVDANEVRVAAANVARNVARQELQTLDAANNNKSADALKNWCGRSAKQFIVEIMAKHYEKHQEFERLLDGAKR